jgi:hypothetical protein
MQPVSVTARMPVACLHEPGGIMFKQIKPVGKRVLNLIRALRGAGLLLPGDKVNLAGEKPAIYVGPLEEDDYEMESIMMHAFKLHDGIFIILELPWLNGQLAKLTY